MIRRLALVAAVCGALIPSVAAHASLPFVPPYVTIQFGRSMEGSYTGTTAQCVPVPGMNNLTYEAQDLAARGFSATLDTVVAYTGATEQCRSGEIYSDWSDIQTLVNQYAWGVTSAGLTYSNVGTMTEAQQEADVCGSLPVFASYGLNANGLFDYPNNSWNTTVQNEVTSTCFDFGRTYKSAINTEAKQVPFGLQGTASITGGMCIAGTANCTQPGPIAGQKGKTYINPVPIETQLATEKSNTWLSFQFYKLVSGAGSDGIFSWDCSSSDPTQHWTSQPEIYCQDDFDAILSAIPGGSIVTSPASVAIAWGIGQP